MPGIFRRLTPAAARWRQAAACTISVTFTPTAPGTRTASLTITDNATGSPQTVNLTGTGSAPLAGVTPTSLTFNSQNLGTTSAAQTVTLNNTGNAALSISGIAFTGANPGDFAETNTCGSSVAAGGSCTISVTFTPSAAGSRTASLNITDNSNNVAGSQQSVSLTGTGTGPSVSLNPSTLSFGSQTQGTTSAAQSITLTNTGNATLTLTSISVTGTNAGDFAQTNTCGGSLAANGTCTINVTFTPTASGSRTASISITDNAPGSPQSVTLTGTGLSGQVSLSPSSLTFTSQNVGTTSTAQNVTLTNTGTASFTIASISLTGTNAGDFSETNGCGSSLAANGTCTITVQFSPTAPGTRTASVSIADSLASSPQTVTLTGTGSGSGRQSLPRDPHLYKPKPGYNECRAVRDPYQYGERDFDHYQYRHNGRESRRFCCHQHLRQFGGGEWQLHDQRHVHACGHREPHSLGEHHGQCRRQPADREPDRHGQRSRSWCYAHQPDLQQPKPRHDERGPDRYAEQHGERGPVHQQHRVYGRQSRRLCGDQHVRQFASGGW